MDAYAIDSVVVQQRFRWASADKLQFAAGRLRLTAGQTLRTNQCAASTFGCQPRWPMNTTVGVAVVVRTTSNADSTPHSGQSLRPHFLR